MASPTIPKHTTGLCAPYASAHIPSACSVPGALGIALPAFQTLLRSYLPCEAISHCPPHPELGWDFSPLLLKASQVLLYPSIYPQYLIMSFITISPVVYELLKSEKKFFSSLYSQLLEPNIWQVMKKSSWDEQKVIYTNVRSVDFPALPGPWKHVNPTLQKWMTTAQRGPKSPIKNRNLETLLFTAALSCHLYT